MMDLGAPSADELAFRPDHFFLTPTTGRGVVRDSFGRIIDRCDVTTRGRWDHNRGALQFDETFSYQNGRSETLSWTFGPDAQGRMTASETSVASPVRGWGMARTIGSGSGGVAKRRWTRSSYSTTCALP